MMEYVTKRSVARVIYFRSNENRDDHTQRDVKFNDKLGECLNSRQQARPKRGRGNLLATIAESGSDGNKPPTDAGAQN